MVVGRVPRVGARIVSRPAPGGAAGEEVQRVHCRHQGVNGIQIAYREAGPCGARTIVLLHGFPTSSHMYPELIPALADAYLSWHDYINRLAQ
jgi:hypothetical protein